MNRDIDLTCRALRYFRGVFEQASGADRTRARAIGIIERLEAIMPTLDETLDSALIAIKAKDAEIVALKAKAAPAEAGLVTTATVEKANALNAATGLAALDGKQTAA
jgi:hypothetical protein